MSSLSDKARGIKTRILAGLASIRAENADMDADSAALLETTERAAHLGATQDATAATLPPISPALQAQIDGMQAQLTAAKSAEHEMLLADFVAQGKLMPAAKPAALGLLQSNEAAFTAFLDAQGQLAALATPEKREAAGGAKEATTTAASTAAALSTSDNADNSTLTNLALARAKADKIGFTQALVLVARENPTLVEANHADMPTLG